MKDTNKKNDERYLRVLNSLNTLKKELIKEWESLNCEILKKVEYDVEQCVKNLLKYYDKLYLSMNKTCHSLQFTACHFIEREHYELAIDSLWQSYIERKFKNIIYRYGSRFFNKSTENDSIKNHEKHERLVLVMIKYLISYVKDPENELNINNLEWVKIKAIDILSKENDEPSKFKPILNNNKCKKNCNCCSNNSVYKTKLCKHYSGTGSCPFGYKCLYAHGKAELRKIERYDNKEINCNNQDSIYLECFKEFMKLCSHRITNNNRIL